MSEWISVDDMLPENNQAVKSKDESGVSYCSRFVFLDEPYFKPIGLAYLHEGVTHWKPV